ncbi:MAG: DNA-3-methyladenine glycosylase [Candidatus Aenigmarchaeota archaeon]|nr:DNA-3-methyladenine glycosylase [Candidatus Aenigmarchaeota archaeon]
MEPLPRSFYERSPDEVAIDLLGKVLVRRLDDKILSGKIVETEAYFGKDDPASRAASGKKKFNLAMWEEVGKAFIYMVHNNWLFNVVAHEPGKVGAVLIRAVQPLEGVEVMKVNRGVDNIKNLTNGPGKLSKAFSITKELNLVDVTDPKSPLLIVEGKKESFEIGKSKRIGVSRDLDVPMRFFIIGNEFVSRKC